MDYLIKEINIKNIPEMVSLVSQVMADDFPFYPIKVIEAYKKIFNEKYFRDFFNNKKNIYFGSFYKNKLIGIFGLKADIGGVAYGDWLVVNKEYRNQGIASALLKKAEKWMINNKFHTYYLYTESEKNISFYRKRGFNYVGTMKKFWFKQDEKIMQKNL